MLNGRIVTIIKVETRRKPLKRRTYSVRLAKVHFSAGDGAVVINARVVQELRRLTALEILATSAGS